MRRGKDYLPDFRLMFSMIFFRERGERRGGKARGAIHESDLANSSLFAPASPENSCSDMREKHSFLQQFMPDAG